jgi:hypothetical protein
VVDGIVFPSNCTDLEVLVKVKDVAIINATDDDTGLISGGHLILDGTLKSLDLKRNTVVKKMYEMSVNGESLFRRTERYNFPAVFLDVDQDEFPNPLCGVNVVGPSWSKKRRILRGLILELLPTSTQVRFRRIGVYNAHDNFSIQTLMANHANEPFLPCLEYDSQFRRHTILII